MFRWLSKIHFLCFFGCLFCATLGAVEKQSIPVSNQIEGFQPVSKDSVFSSKFIPGMPSNLSCDLLNIKISYRAFRNDSLERKTTITFRIQNHHDSAQQVVWSQNMTAVKMDTVLFDPQMFTNSHAKTIIPETKSVARKWTRWLEPFLALTTVSSLVYLFYSVRSSP